MNSLEQFFNEQRNESYMVAFDKVDHSIHDILFKYYTLAIRSGFTIEDKLENPTVEQNTFFNNTLTSDFQLSEQFIQMKLIKWLSLAPSKAQIIAHSIYSVFTDLNKMGKNESSLKNTYVKFMCWLYYKFEIIPIDNCFFYFIYNHRTL